MCKCCQSLGVYSSLDPGFNEDHVFNNIFNYETLKPLNL